MAQEKIIIRFEPKGHDKLLRALRELRDVQAQVAGTSKKLNDGTVLGTRNSRLMSNSFATLRSKLLLFNFAMAMGVRQLIQFAEQAAKVESMGRAFDTLSGGTSKSSIAMEQLRVATNGTMSQFDLFQQANNAMILGVSKNSEEMAEMFDIAQRLGRALGRDTASSVESLITGIGRQSRLMLDNIGIIVKADEAYASYASRLGKTVDSLTDSEKKTAFLEATMESARDKVLTLGGETLTTQDSFDRFKATVNDLAIATGSGLKNAFSGAMDAFSDFVDVQKDADVQTALSTKSIQIMEITIKRLKQDIRDVHRSQTNFALGLNAGVRAGELAGDQLENLNKIIRQLEINLKNAKFEQNLFGETLEDIAYWSSELGESLETNLSPSLSFIDELYKQTNESQLALVESRIALIEGVIENNGATNEEIAVLALLIEKRNTLLGLDKQQREEDRKKAKAKRDKARADKKEEDDRITAEKNWMSVISQSASINQGASRANALIAKRAAQLEAIVNTSSAYTEALPNVPLALSIAALGAVQVAKIEASKFATGGLVGGRRHSQGGTLIEAEQGEFVMSRSAVESVGIENLNRMNQGGGGSITVNIQGNLLSEEYVETELAEKISTAVRRGVDFGIS